MFAHLGAFGRIAALWACVRHFDAGKDSGFPIGWDG